MNIFNAAFSNFIQKFFFSSNLEKKRIVCKIDFRRTSLNKCLNEIFCGFIHSEAYFLS